ncbi:unnamed protein product [Acanthoscelides obtectus]|nr:unnamed protein product [Acanthoscelides obtectus]CAK1671987.1 hypothetical protein AOBTE_LOCUS28594 [Acanthoscelides obtectus]
MSAVIPSDPVSALGQDGVNPSGAEGAGHDQSGLPGTGFGSSPSLPGGGQSDIGSGLPQQPTAQRPPGVNPSYNDNNSDDDDGDDPAPFNLSPKKGGPSYNIFFPIELRHRARSAAKSSRNYNAIANSFATGRKGIANSHSLTHGDAATQQASAQGQIEQKPEV